MHAKSDNVELVSYKVNDIVDKLFESLCSRYQVNLETSMERRHFVFKSVELLFCKYPRINFGR